MPVPVDGVTVAELSKGFIAMMATGIGGLASALVWVVRMFTDREAKVISSNTEAVENLADIVEANTASTEAVGEHLQTANQLKHDEQLLAADRRQRRGDAG